jgi:protein TonB
MRALMALVSVLGTVLFWHLPASAQQSYRVRVTTHLMHYKRFPSEAFRRGEVPGTALVRFAIDGRGRLTHVLLVRSSGSAYFDQEAIATVRRASPFPPPPEGRALSFTAPLRFTYRN